MPTADTYVAAPATVPPVSFGAVKVPVLKSGSGSGSGGTAPTTGQIWPL